MSEVKKKNQLRRQPSTTQFTLMYRSRSFSSWFLPSFQNGSSSGTFVTKVGLNDRFCTKTHFHTMANSEITYLLEWQEFVRNLQFSLACSRVHFTPTPQSGIDNGKMRVGWTHRQRSSSRGSLARYVRLLCGVLLHVMENGHYNNLLFSSGGWRDRPAKLYLKVNTSERQ